MEVPSSSSSSFRNPGLATLAVSVVLAFVVLFGLATTSLTNYPSSSTHLITQLTEYSTPYFNLLFNGEAIPDEPEEEKSSSKSTSTYNKVVSSYVPDLKNPFTLYSDHMVNGGNMPYTYTCMATGTKQTGSGVSPPLAWKNVPTGTKQFLLTMQTDAFAHNGEYILTRCDWAIYGIPKSTTSIPANVGDSVGVVGGTYPGDPMYNYNAPCPFGSGNNTYYFTVYALADDLQTMVEEKLEKKAKFDVGLKMITYADKKGIIIDKAQLAVSFCMYSDDLASCQTKAQGGVFKEPVEMDLWNADDYVVAETDQRTDTEEGKGFQDVHLLDTTTTTTIKTASNSHPSIRCDWCTVEEDAL